MVVGTIRRQLSLLLALLLAFTFTTPIAHCETETSEAEISLGDFQRMPVLSVLAPNSQSGYEGGTSLRVHVKGQNITLITVSLALAQETLQYQQDGDELEYTFTFEPQTKGALLTVRGYAQDGASYDEQIITVLSPKQALIDKMIDLAHQNSKDDYYAFAPAEPGTERGVCKMFVMRLFNTYSKGYRMLAYPDTELHMPVNKSKAASAPYDYGIEWKFETAQEGSPFEIAAQYKYDDTLTKEENQEICRNVLRQIQKGDFFQMVANYGGGNGPHSMFMIKDYDPDTDMLHWTDSNMRGKRVNGVRWGYLQWDADATAEWFVECIFKSSMKKRGCTLYRLRDDLIQCEK